MEAVRDRRTKPIRLDLIEADRDRLDRVARAKGLSKSSYVRMILLERLKAEGNPWP